MVQKPAMETKNTKPTVKSLVKETSLPDCLENYSDIKMVTDQEGTIVLVAREMMISFGDSGRFNPCNLPDGYNEGDSVVFSGAVKDSPKGVRLAGTPFKLTFISKK